MLLMLVLVAIINNPQKRSDSKKNYKKMLFLKIFFSKLGRKFSVKQKKYYIKNKSFASAVTNLQNPAKLCLTPQ